MYKKANNSSEFLLSCSFFPGISYYPYLQEKCTFGICPTGPGTHKLFMIFLKIRRFGDIKYDTEKPGPLGDDVEVTLRLLGDYLETNWRLIGD